MHEKKYKKIKEKEKFTSIALLLASLSNISFGHSWK